MIKRRNGYSLIELLVVITLLGFVLGAVTVSLYGFQRAQLKAREEFDQRSSIDQFVARFRSDAHAARSAEVIPAVNQGRGRLRLILPTPNSVEYAVGNREIVRTRLEGDSAVQQDRLVLEAAADALFEVEPGGEGSLVTIWLPLSTGSSQGPVIYPFQAAVHASNPESTMPEVPGNSEVSTERPAGPN